jgi:hypothetical protein
LAVALLLLWVRSFYIATDFRQQVTSTLAFSVIAQRGFVGAVVFNPISEVPRGYYKWGVSTMDLSRLPKPDWDLRMRRRPDIYVQIMLPLWFVMLTIAASSVVALRMEWRFTLRTLLIAMTGVAVLLGLILWVVRWPAT